MMEKISLVKAEEKDVDFIYDMMEKTMFSHVVDIWGRWDREFEFNLCVNHSKNENCYLICEDSKKIGAFIVDRKDSHIQLEQIFILPDFQGKGIGLFLVSRLIDEAKMNKKPIKLRVLRPNPAKRFYLNLDFKVVEETKERFFMEYHPDE